MIFNSFSFFLFIAIVVALHNLPFSWKVKKTNLLLASYLFYAVWNPPFVLLLWLSTIADYIIGKKIFAEKNNRRRKLLLFASLAINLGMLGYFKYGTFLLDNFVALLSLAGIHYQPAVSGIILPVGISFYTFQTLSYTLDMYKRNGRPERSLLDFSLFVTFFPQLVAGPIVRPSELLPQFKIPHQASRLQFIKGLALLSTGLFMKVVLADTLLSGTADLVFGAAQPLLALDAWLGVLAFSGQIFFDFAGYSTCAIGVAALLGFSLPENFKYPYAASSFSDFWRRWHITLSTWLRDYLYIPLGGNRGSSFRMYVNLLITMLLGGLWHGASWNFVVWGALHGFFLVAEKAVRKIALSGGLMQWQPALLPGKNNRGIVKNSFAPHVLGNKKFQAFGRSLFIFGMVCITWVFFRATDFSTAWRLLQSMFGAAKAGAAIVPTVDIIKVAVVTGAMLGIHWYMRDTNLHTIAIKSRWWLVAIGWSLMLILLVLSQKSSGSFIYFQF